MDLINPEHIYIVKAAACIAAGFCMGIGGLGPSIGQGYIAGKACESLGKKPEDVGPIRSTMFQAMLMIETSLIFIFLTSVILIFFTT
jgi:F-type H+-transporting ATPase subunit c